METINDRMELLVNERFGGNKDAFTLHTKMNCASSDVKFLDTCDVYLDDVHTDFCKYCFNDAKYEHLMRIAERNGWR